MYILHTDESDDEEAQGDFHLVDEKKDRKAMIINSNSGGSSDQERKVEISEKVLGSHLAKADPLNYDDN
jgi:hypothetical protein